jgi:hypothetical protein
MKRMLKPVTYVFAAVYFLVDAVFMTVARPVADWIGRRLHLRRLCNWIRSLRPWPSFALFSVPVVILEPVKPVAAYLAATGRMLESVLMLVSGELVKLVLVELLFSLTRDKLMKIHAFAVAYGKFREAKAWIEATEAWRAVQRLKQRVHKTARDIFAQMKSSGAVPFRQS